MDGLGALPPSLAAALALRIERLGDDAQEVVRVLSAGGQLDDAVLAEVAALDRRALREGLREAVASHIVVLDGDRYTLRHALVREAVHDDLLPGERAELHRALARALEEQAEAVPSAQRAAAIAHHYLAAGDQPAALAAAVRAGMAAMGVQAYREGATLFERALELWDRVPDAAELTGTDEVELLERASACHYYADDLARSVTLAKRALALVDEAAAPRRAAWLYGMLQRSLWSLLRADEAVAALERGLACSPTTGRAPSAPACSPARPAMLMLQSRYHRAVSVARRALAEQAELTEQGAAHLDYAGALNALGVSLAATGEIEEGVAALRRALDDRRRARRPAGRRRRRGEPQRGAAPGRPHRRGARRGARRPRQLVPLPTRQLWLSLAIAQYAFDSGDWEAAEGAMAGVERRRFSSGNSELNACLRHAELALGRDEREAAREQLARAARAGGRLARAAVPRRAGRAAGGAGDARGRHRGRARGGRRGARPDRVLLGRRAAHGDGLGRRADAEATAAQHARDLGDGEAVARRARPRRAAGRTRAGMRRGRRAARAGDTSPMRRPTTAARSGPTRSRAGRGGRRRVGRLGRPYPAAIARWRQAEALVAAGDREAAVGPATEAIAVAERLGAAWLCGELESLAARARLRLDGDGDGAGTAPAGDDGDDPFGLTPRERQVLALVAAGATNREIGRQLYMAEKTASVHVSRILAKLDVRSRTEAAGVAHRLGLDARGLRAATPRRRAPHAPPGGGDALERRLLRGARAEHVACADPAGRALQRRPERVLGLAPLRVDDRRHVRGRATRPENRWRSPPAVTSVWCRIAMPRSSKRAR